MWPMRCDKRWIGTCSPIPRGGGARRHTGAGAPAGFGSLPPQRQPRPIRRIDAPGRQSSTPRHQRVGSQADQQPGRSAPCPHRSCRRRPRCQRGRTPPRPRHRRADRGQPRQHDHRRRLHHLDLGAIVGQEDRPVQPRHARRRAGRRTRGHRRAPAPGGTRSTALSQHCLCAPGCRKPWRSASTAVRRAACAPTATSPRRRWPPCKRGRA